ncbi:hypothetical protein NIES4102_12940 [Chondrocystis sp. NIES-4102]|nr:hypothetical protein NIES4102_12940 [Chondrocystis sp. NIES-4102]
MENNTPDDANYDPNVSDKDAGYDANITSAETAARIEREGENFGKTPVAEGELDTTAGYTVDREGLGNNYAIEPEMYYEEPGDRREVEAAEKAERAQELEEINSPGGKGPGVI